MTRYVCIGAPYYIGQLLADRTEVAAVEKSGIAAEIGAEWVTINPDFGAAPDPVVAVNRALAETVRAHADCVPLVFASDCCFAMGMLKGLGPQKPAVIWYDAHGDFNTDETTPSGFLGGMPLAWLVGDGDQQYMQGVGLEPVAQSDVIISDARDLDSEEAVRLRQSKLVHLDKVSDLLTQPLPHKPVYIHMDTDVVDIEEMPGMNYPAPNGPSLAQTNATLDRLAKEAEIAGMLFSLWNDSLPTGGKSLAGVLSMIRTVVGAKT